MDLPAVAKRRLHDQVNSANAVAQQLNVAANTPRSQWGQLSAKAEAAMNLAGGEAASFDPRMGEEDFAVKANRMKNQNSLMASLKNMQAAQDKDPANFVANSDPHANILWRAAQSGLPEDTQKYANYTLQKQRYLGIAPDKIRVLPDSVATTLAMEIQAQPDAIQANQYITNMQQKYGPNFNRVMGEIAGTDKSLQRYKTLALVNPTTRTNLLDSIRNEPAINKAIASDDVLKTNSKTIDQKSANIVQGFKGALAGVSSDSASVESVNNIQSLVALQAKRGLVADPSADPEDLVAAAYQDVVGRNFEIVDGGNSSVLIPRQIGQRTVNAESAKIFKSFMTVYSKPENLDTLGVYVPKNHCKAHYSNGPP